MAGNHRPEAVVLGSGTSHGVPCLGKAYTEAYLRDPKNHRTRPALALLGPEGTVLVDCAPEMRTQLIRESIDDIDAVILTHSHADHIMGMDDVRALCRRKGSMPVYALPETQSDVRRIFSYAFAEFPPGVWVPRFELRDVPTQLDLVGLKILTFWVWHGPHRVLAFRINDFAYLTDVSRIPTYAESFLQDLDVLILDAVRYKPHPNHMHLDRAVEEALRIGARQTFFTHLSDDYDHEPMTLSLPQGIDLAYDGLRIPL